MMTRRQLVSAQVHDSGAFVAAPFADRSATVGAGWVLPVWRGLYLNPWAAGHAPLGASGVTVGAERYQPRAFEAEVSLKVGRGTRGSP